MKVLNPFALSLIGSACAGLAVASGGNPAKGAATFFGLVAVVFFVVALDRVRWK